MIDGRCTPEETLRETVETWEHYDRVGKDAATALNVSESTITRRLRRASELGLIQDSAGPPTPGRVISGVSTLYDGDGNIKAQWVKERADKEQLDQLADVIRDSFSDMRGLIAPTRPPLETQGDLVSVYPIADVHHGMYAWAEETGEDWDLDKASDTMIRTSLELMSTTPNADRCLILVLGDYFHFDTLIGTTTSGTPLDTDTRYQKVARAGIDNLRDVIAMALMKHESVEVEILPGNHDQHTAMMMKIAVALIYENEPRITVSQSPRRVIARQFGNVMIAATHGDMLKGAKMHEMMAGVWGEMWGATKFRYGYTGHVHSKNAFRSEAGGAVVESFQTIAPKDAWHYGMGYVSGRSMQSITHHVDRGEISRSTVAL